MDLGAMAYGNEFWRPLGVQGYSQIIWFLTSLPEPHKPEWDNCPSDFDV